VLKPGAKGRDPAKDIGGKIAFECVITKVQGAEVDGMTIATVKYPDGFEKNHQADEGIHDLMGKVQNMLRGRYGVSSFSVAEMPTEVAPDAVFKFDEVTYDA
jgi:hypothetical protein